MVISGMCREHKYPEVQVWENGKLLLKENYMDKWKRLEDEKPKYASEVIACTNNGVKHLLFVGEQKWRDLTEGDMSVFGASFITHWMESPELPDEYNKKR